MKISHRAVLTGLVAALVVNAGGCGGSETADIGTRDAASTTLKGGGSGSTSAAYLTITPDPVDRNAPTTISFYPGSFMTQSLFIKFVCYQNGYMDDVDGSYELHAAASQGFAGYTSSADHFSWTFVLSEGMNYGLQAGPANCNVTGWYVNKRQQWYQVASATFSVQ